MTIEVKFTRVYYVEDDVYNEFHEEGETPEQTAIRLATNWFVGEMPEFLDNIEEGDRMIVIGKKEDKIIYADIIRSGERNGIRGMMPFSRLDKEDFGRPSKRQFNLK